MSPEIIGTLLVYGLVGTQIYLLKSNYLVFEDKEIISFREFIKKLPTVFIFTIYPFMQDKEINILLIVGGALANTVDLWYTAYPVFEINAPPYDLNADQFLKYQGFMTLFLIPLEIVYYHILKNTFD